MHHPPCTCHACGEKPSRPCPAAVPAARAGLRLPPAPALQTLQAGQARKACSCKRFSAATA